MLLLMVLAGLVFPMQAPRERVQAQAAGSGSRTFAGVLVDFENSNCGTEVAKAVGRGRCPASFRTTNFGLEMAAGKLVKFDESGNAKVIDALKRSKKSGKALFEYWRTGKATVILRATAVGALTSDTLNLESIRID